MKKRSIQAWSANSWTAMLLLMVAVAAVPTTALAQDEQDGPRQGRLGRGEQDQRQGGAADQRAGVEHGGDLRPIRARAAQPRLSASPVATVRPGAAQLATGYDAPHT